MLAVNKPISSPRPNQQRLKGSLKSYIWPTKSVWWGELTPPINLSLIEISDKTIKGTRCGSKEYCAVITLDVKNGFNSVFWHHINQALDTFKRHHISYILLTVIYLIEYCYMIRMTMSNDITCMVEYHRDRCWVHSYGTYSMTESFTFQWRKQFKS